MLKDREMIVDSFAGGGGGVMGSRLAHENEAPFPEALAEFFIRSFCPPGGTVLDPFCGSGTTLAVAKSHGRKFAGLDIRPSQIELSERRLAEAIARPNQEEASRGAAETRRSAGT